jgi:hypothetical protein
VKATEKRHDACLPIARSSRRDSDEEGSAAFARFELVASVESGVSFGDIGRALNSGITSEACSPLKKARHSRHRRGRIIPGIVRRLGHRIPASRMGAGTSVVRARRTDCRRVTKLGMTLALLTVATLALTQCSPTPKKGVGASTSTAQSSTTVETVVRNDGFFVSLDGVTVTGPAGVASSGTTVRVKQAPRQLPGRWSEFAKPLATGVDVQLADGQQPNAPVTISFADVGAAKDVFVLAKSANGDVHLLAYQKSGPIEVTTNHLSSFWPILVNISNLADTVFRSATEALQMTSTRPDCFIEHGEYPNLGLRITQVTADVVWPCLAQISAAVTLSLKSNSSLAWRVKTNPEWIKGGPTAYTAANILALSAWQAAAPNAADEEMLLPGETVTFETGSPVSTTVGMLVDPVMSQIRTLALGIGFLLPDEAVKAIGRSECLPDLIHSGGIAEEPSATGFAAIFRCFGAAIGGAGGALLSLLAGAPAALWAQLEGLLRTATARDQVTFTVESTKDAALPKGTGDPINRADVEAWLGEWTGPVNQSGSKPYSVHMKLVHNGKTVVGTVEYPELSCSGTLDGASLQADVLSIEETIAVNGECVTTVDLKLTLRANEIFYHFNAAGGGNGVLRRP